MGGIRALLNFLTFDSWENQVGSIQTGVCDIIGVWKSLNADGPRDEPFPEKGTPGLARALLSGSGVGVKKK